MMNMKKNKTSRIVGAILAVLIILAMVIPIAMYVL